MLRFGEFFILLVLYDVIERWVQKRLPPAALVMRGSQSEHSLLKERATGAKSDRCREMVKWAFVPRREPCRATLVGTKN